MSKMPSALLVIRKSRSVPDLILTCNREKVYRVFLFKQEMMNDLDYDKVSNYFNQLEAERKI